jgi:hypothetical protein
MRRDPLYIFLVVVVVLLALHLAKLVAFTLSWPVILIVAVICVILMIR